jgi:hypothetical protein
MGWLIMSYDVKSVPKEEYYDYYECEYIKKLFFERDEKKEDYHPYEFFEDEKLIRKLFHVFKTCKDDEDPIYRLRYKWIKLRQETKFDEEKITNKLKKVFKKDWIVLVCLSVIMTDQELFYAG